MEVLLDKFKDLRELLDIIQFQTGKTLEGVAIGAGYTGAHLRAERGKNNNNKLLEALKKDYGKEVEQFVRKYGELYIEVKDSLDCGTNSKLPDQVLISALSSVAKVQHLLAEHLERISESALSGNLSKLDTSTTNLEAVAASFREGTGDEKGTENTDKANRNKKT